jgi:hypothetical protein
MKNVRIAILFMTIGVLVQIPNAAVSGSSSDFTQMVAELFSDNGVMFGQLKVWRGETAHDLTVRMPPDAFPIISDFNSFYKTV